MLYHSAATAAEAPFESKEREFELLKRFFRVWPVGQCAEGYRAKSTQLRIDWLYLLCFELHCRLAVRWSCGS